MARIGEHKIAICPDLAPDYRRDGLPPNPDQVVIGEPVRWRIITALEDATDMVMSHLHSDDGPLPDANATNCKASGWRLHVEPLDFGPRQVDRRSEPPALGRPRYLLEARRVQSPGQMPVSDGWLEAYA